MASAWPIDVVALRPIACGSVLWSSNHALRLTVVVKATFGLVHEGTVRLIAPVALVPKDVHRDRSPTRSLESASDLAPYLRRADVLVEGHAYAPPGRAVPATSVRLALLRGRPLIDKTLHVFGDRSPSAPGAPAGFQRMPLVYERAYGGAGFAQNPVGVGAGPNATALPNVVDPEEPSRPAGFGPISRVWSARASLLDPARRRLFDLAVPELGTDFPLDYLQAAPADQQCDFLEGSEWMVLDGMSPSSPRLVTRLPGASALAHVHEVGPDGVGPASVLALAADMLVVNADRQACSVTWRGVLPLKDQASLASLRVFAAIELPGLSAPWPSPDQIQAVPAPSPRASSASLPAMLSTMSDAPGARRAPALPFVPGSPPSSRAGPSSPATPANPIAPSGDEPSTRAVPLTESPPSLPRPPPPPALLAPIPSPPASVRLPPPEAAPNALDQTAAVSIEAVREAAARALAHFTATPNAEPIRPASLAGVLAGPPPRDAPALASPPAPRPVSAPRASKAPGDPPPRTGEVARIVTASTLSAATLAWQLRPPRDSVTIVVKGTFDLVPDGPARPRDESDLVIGDLYVDDDPEKSLAYASDFAVLKTMADVTVVGHAYAPGKRSAASQVVFRFGTGKKRIERTLHVFGDRRWQKTVISLAPTDPAPFERIPLTYERAFGGPTYEPNPVGVGYKAAASADGVARLPNVELVGRHVTGPGDAPPPACLAPIPVTWKERWSNLGTYDRAWFRTRWPYFPEDFDLAFFQSAPAAQRTALLDGDEPYEVGGMRPDHPLLRGTLPGVRARAFVQRTKEHGGAFTEVPLVLDTAAFDLEAMKVNLVWRGNLEVIDEDAPEIQHWFVIREALASPRASVEQARELYLATAAPQEPVAEEPDAPKPANETRPSPEPPDPELEKLERLLEENRKASEARLAADGPLPPPPPADPEAIAATLRASGASEEDIANVLEVLKPPEEKPAEKEEAPAPSVDRAFVIAILEAGRRFDGMNLEGLDLSDLDFTRRSLVETTLRGAKLCRAVFSKATLSDALLSGADLTDAKLDDASLGGADFVGAKLDGASFAGASISAADFSGASADGASFVDAIGKKAVFHGASLRKARFDGTSLDAADFTGADVTDASFVGADLPKLRMYDVKGERAVFDRAFMPNARLEGASFPRGSLEQINAEGAVFERANLTEAKLHGANLKGASFLRASSARAIFSRADLADARLRRADLRGAALLKANLMNANLERADLTGADLRGANLHSAGLWKAKMVDAKLDGAILTKSTLVMRRQP